MIKTCSCCGRVFRTEEDFFTDTFYWRLDTRNNLYFTCSCSSTLMIKKGKHDWYAPQKTLSSEASQVFNTLSMGDLIPQIPQGIAQLQRLLNNHDVDIKEVTYALKFEPIVLSDVLKIANLMTKSKNHSIKTIDHAVVYMGLRALKDLVTAAALRSLNFKSKLFQFDEFWEESFVAASLAEKLCQNMSLNVSSEEVYLASCLANAGKIIYATSFPDMADRIFHEARNSKISWRSAEISFNYPDHSILGEIAGAFWGLPRYVIVASLNHHAKKDTRTRRREEGKINSVVIVAHQLKNILFDRRYEVEEDLLNESIELIGLSRKDIHIFLRKYSTLRDNIRANIVAA